MKQGKSTPANGSCVVKAGGVFIDITDTERSIG